MKLYQLIYSQYARDDLWRLFEFLAEFDEQLAETAIESIEAALDAMRRYPMICRMAQGKGFDPNWRELVIQFGSSGYVALFEITGEQEVTVMAIKHQRESDYH